MTDQAGSARDSAPTLQEELARLKAALPLCKTDAEFDALNDRLGEILDAMEAAADLLVQDFSDTVPE